MVSYNLRLIPSEKIWEDMMINPSIDLGHLMTWVEMFSRLEDDVSQVERATVSSSSVMSHSKFSLGFERSHTIENLLPWEEIPKNAIKVGNVPSTRRKDT